MQLSNYVNFQTATKDYQHWNYEIDGAVAYLSMSVNPDGGLFEGYEMKMNSYDLGVDIELYDVGQRLRFEHPGVRVVVVRSALERMFCAGANIKMLGKLIGRCDPGKAVPVLLRHYLSLNGKMVCFNIHADFNDSLEGLIIVDARNTHPKTLTRFMGVEGYNMFNALHKLPQSA